MENGSFVSDEVPKVSKSDVPDVALPMNGHEVRKREIVETLPRIEWQNLAFEIKKSNFKFKPPINLKLISTTKRILEPQSGCIKSGQMTALMGPSGAGKTTLLNAIIGHCDHKNVSGQVNFVTTSNQTTNQKMKKLAIKISFVPQKDFLQQNFSIRETLTFATKFSLISNNQPLKGLEIKMKVEKLAMDINLFNDLDTKISDCSTGQVKRVSVAIELISNPNILILDEPTTGLDSTNALAMVTTIKKLIQRRDSDLLDAAPAVICAIHQPSIDVFDLFDQIYVMANGGKNIYSGPPSNVPKFLAMNNISLTASSNPADFLLLLCQTGNQIVTMDCIDIDKNQSENEISTPISEVMKESAENSHGNHRLLQTFLVLVQRQFMIVKHNPWPVIIRLLCCIFSTFVVKSIYNHKVGVHSGCYSDIFGFNDPPKNESLTTKLFNSNLDHLYNESWMRATRVLDNVGYLLITAAFIVMVHTFMALVEVPSEVKIIMKEVSNNWYGVNNYLSAKLCVSFFILIFHVSFFSFFMFYISDQELDLEKYLLITLSWLLLAYISELMGVTIGVIFHADLVIAVLIQVYAIFPLILFSGYLAKPITIPDGLKQLTNISQLKHVFYAMIITVYGRGRCQPYADEEFTFSEYLKLPPIKLFGHFMESNNVTFETSDLVSPILGLPNSVCLAQVINATRDYLSIRTSEPQILNESIDRYNDSDSDDEDDLSFPLSMFGINEEDLSFCYISLVTIFMTYLFVCYVSYRRVVVKHVSL